MEWESDTFTMRFTLIEGDESLAVVYHGVVPDSLQEGREAVVGGIYDTDGFFLADTILTKCPSKYAPQE